MAKKQKDDIPNPNSVANRDILQRLSYLYQASQLLGTSSVPPPPVPGPIPAGLHGAERRLEARRRTRERHGTAPADLARAYVRDMRAIGMKTNMRMDPAVKRTLCKGCDMVLVPGLTAQVRVNTSSNAGNVVCYTCLSCHKPRRFPAPPVIDESAALEPAPAPSEVQATSGEANALGSMEIDATDPPVPSTSKTSKREKRKRRPAPRLPPLFERNVGHVVFRGNERIS